MKQFWKRVLAALLMGIVALGFIYINKSYGSEYGAFYMLLVVLMPGLNSFFRLYNWSKPFISSRYNIFTSKYRRNLTIDLPSKVAYGKFIEVIENSGMVLETTNDSSFELFAYTKSSLKTTGVNLYIQFLPLSEVCSKMAVLSVSFMIFDDGRSHQTLIDLIDEFENSLTI
tara:strand:- start:43190 stop:43702 length:513 start_codon:yes stop_codon:yes gene_type:complete